MTADETIIKIMTTQDGPQVTWPWAAEPALIKPQVAVGSGSTDVVLLALRPLRLWRAFGTRRVTLPVDATRAGLFRVLNTLAAIPQAVIAFGAVAVVFGTATAQVFVSDWSGWPAAAAFVLSGLLSVLALVVNVIHRVAPQFPQVRSGRIVVDQAGAGFATELVRLNPGLDRPAAPVRDAFADKYAAAG